MIKTNWSLERRLRDVNSTCPNLDTSVNSYTGSMNILDYCNTTCNSICPPNFNCNDNCDRLAFPYNPNPTPSNLENLVIAAVQNCASTLRPGPIGCESIMTNCCTKAVDSTNPDAYNQCDIYSQGYCVNQSFTNPTQAPDNPAINPDITIQPQPPIQQPTPAVSTCPILDATVNSYTGSMDILDYCNSTCSSLCSSDFNCNDNCNRLVTDNLRNKFENTVIVAVQNCGTTTTTGPTDCELTITNCCVNSVDSTNAFAYNDCDVYSKKYCENQAPVTDVPTQAPVTDVPTQAPVTDVSTQAPATTDVPTQAPLTNTFTSGGSSAVLSGTSNIINILQNKNFWWVILFVALLFLVLIFLKYKKY